MLSSNPTLSRWGRERWDCGSGSPPRSRPGGAHRPCRCDGWHHPMGRTRVGQHQAPAGPAVGRADHGRVPVALLAVCPGRGMAPVDGCGTTGELSCQRSSGGAVGAGAVGGSPGPRGRLAASGSARSTGRASPATRSRRFALPGPDRGAVGAHERGRRRRGRGDILPRLHAETNRAPARARDRDPGNRRSVRPRAFLAPGGQFRSYSCPTTWLRRLFTVRWHTSPIPRSRAWSWMREGSFRRRRPVHPRAVRVAAVCRT